jgi:hypothetical protein
MASEPTELCPPADALTGAELVHIVQGGNSRRTTIAAMLVGALMSWIPAPGLAAINLQTSLRLGLPTMPDHFAAVGDGVADDYQPFQDLAAYISGNGGGRVACARARPISSIATSPPVTASSTSYSWRASR